MLNLFGFPLVNAGRLSVRNVRVDLPRLITTQLGVAVFFTGNFFLTPDDFRTAGFVFADGFFFAADRFLAGDFFFAGDFLLVAMF